MMSAATIFWTVGAHKVGPQNSHTDFYFEINKYNRITAILPKAVFKESQPMPLLKIQVKILMGVNYSVTDKKHLKWQEKELLV